MSERYYRYVERDKPNLRWRRRYTRKQVESMSSRRFSNGGTWKNNTFFDDYLWIHVLYCRFGKKKQITS